VGRSAEFLKARTTTIRRASLAMGEELNVNTTSVLAYIAQAKLDYI